MEKKKSNDVPDGFVVECSKKVGDIVKVSELEMVVVYIAENYTESTPQNSARLRLLWIVCVGICR